MTRTSDLVGEGLEAKPGAVVGGGLLGIAHPPLDVIKLEESPSLRLGTLVSVGRPDGSLVRARHLSSLGSLEGLEDEGATHGRHGGAAKPPII